MSMRCANCGIQFDWQPTIIDGITYCCLGCSRGGPCNCDYSRLPHSADKAALVLHGGKPVVQVRKA
jgi:hypothetical protein